MYPVRPVHGSGVFSLRSFTQVPPHCPTGPRGRQAISPVEVRNGLGRAQRIRLAGGGQSQTTPAKI
jgi:hypothetical protein